MSPINAEQTVVVSRVVIVAVLFIRRACCAAGRDGANESASQVVTYVLSNTVRCARADAVFRFQIEHTQPYFSPHGGFRPRNVSPSRWHTGIILIAPPPPVT